MCIYVNCTYYCFGTVINKYFYKLCKILVITVMFQWQGTDPNKILQALGLSVNTWFLTKQRRLRESDALQREMTPAWKTLYGF
jgi:hypothetical protein